MLTYTETDRHTDIQTYRQTDRQTDTDMYMYILTQLQIYLALRRRLATIYPLSE